MSTYNVIVAWDEEANVWTAISDEIPLALESNSYDALLEKVKVAAPEILELNSDVHLPANFLVKSERLVAIG